MSKGLTDHSLEDDIVIVGRNPDCSVIINDKRLSGKHCRIEKRDTGVFVVDTSTNGTFIKDERIGKGKEK